MPVQDDALVLDDFRGGMNDTDDPLGLASDEVASAINVEFFASRCGERRNGMLSLNLTTAPQFSNVGPNTAVTHIDEWYPTSDFTAPEWFIMAGVVNSSEAAYKTNNFGATFTSIGMDDQAGNDISNLFQITTVPLNGLIPLLFIAYRTGVGGIDRMHVYDGNNVVIRRSGFTASINAVSNVANTGAGSYSGTRYFRARFLQQSGALIIRRSEPGPSTAFTPSGSGSGALISIPNVPGERETHWEVEASEDNATFYRVATLAIGTTTYTDTVAFSTGYSSFPLSDPIGTYLPCPAAKYVASDSDRLLMGGHLFDATRASSIYWTPVFNDPFPGAFERLPLNKNNSVNLDNGDGGPVTGISSSVNGVWYAFKWQKIYAVVRTYNANIEYNILTMSTEHGAIPNSVVMGADESGAPCVYFLDPTSGPMRVGPNGIQFIRGLRTTWKRMNLHATQRIAHGVYYPYKRQIKWWVSFDGANQPNTILNAQVSNMKTVGPNEVRGGWSIHTGIIAQAMCSGALSGVPVTGATDSLNARPCAGYFFPYLLESLDVSDYDAGTQYMATIVTKPYMLAGAMDRWGVRTGSGVVSPSTVQTLSIQISRDFSRELSKVFTLSMAPQTVETQVVSDIDNMIMSNARVIQLTITDGSTL